MLQKILATLKISASESSYFGVMNILSEYMLKWLRLLGLLLIWRMLFKGGADMQGMTLNQMLSYTLLSAAFAPLLDIRTAASSWLQDGSFLALFQRPMGIFTQLVTQTIGAWAIHLCMFALPALVLGAFLNIGLNPMNPWAFLSLLLTISQGFAVDFLFACLIIRANSISYQIDALRRALGVLLTGALIPFAALPFNLGKYLALTPFGTLAGAPLSIYVGLESAFPLIYIQILWNVILWPLALYLFNRSMERMVAYGG